MSLQSIDARISKIEQRVTPASTGEVHAIYEADPVIGRSQRRSLENTDAHQDSDLVSPRTSAQDAVMRRSIETRLKNIEARLSPAAFRTCRRVVGDSVAECEDLTAALIANGRASSSDTFIHRVMVTP